MNLENISEGQVFKNYKELCSALDEKVKTGNAKKYQLIDWDRYFSYEKDGHKFVIKEIYKEVKDKINNRGKHNIKYLNLYKQSPELCKNIVDDYGNNLTKLTKSSHIIIKWKCSNCLIHHDKAIRRVFKNNHSKCTRCSSSSKEIFIMDMLNSLKIKFIKELTFDELIGKNNNYLRFDFGILDGDNLRGLVEYDGEYHDVHIGTQQYDEVKNKYCSDNNIDLLRIHHTESKDIEKILIKKLYSWFPDKVELRDKIQGYIDEKESELKVLQSELNELKIIINENKE